MEELPVKYSSVHVVGPETPRAAFQSSPLSVAVLVEEHHRKLNQEEEWKDQLNRKYITLPLL